MQEPDKALARHVLVVDDHVDSGEVFAAILEEAGHHVVLVHDGERALKAMMEETFDIAFIDVGLPVLDGYEVVRRARTHLGERTPALVATTGYARVSDCEDAARAGFDVHLAKPVAPSALLAAVAASRKQSR